jgi:hypothetical protein
VISIILGTVTHIIWDGFTHGNGIFVQVLPDVYKGTTVDFRGMHFPLWYALQHISTIVGGAILGVYILMIKPAAGTYNRPNLLYWSILTGIVGIITFIRMQWPVHNEKMVVIVITMIASFCIGITILGLIPSFRRRNA